MSIDEASLFIEKYNTWVLSRKSRSPVYRSRLLLKYITWVQVRLLRLVSFWNAFGAMEAKDTELREEPLLGFIRKKEPLYPCLYSERASKQNLPVKCSCSEEESQKRACIHEINNQGESNVDVVLNLNHSTIAAEVCSDVLMTTSTLLSSLVISSVKDPDGCKTFSRIRIRIRIKVFHRSNHMYELKHFGMVWQRHIREKCCGAQRKPYF
jgi:hypothetical protein